MFAIKAGSDNITFTPEVPSPAQIKQKVILILKARTDKSAPEITDDNASQELIMMEVNRQILENLY